ncbi:MAG TPA: hypothetical protein VI452_07610 [Marmoricola sp.]|jgi:hypothetical protein
MDDRERSQLQAVLLKGAAVLVAICLVVALGTLVMVKALGLDDKGASGGTTTAVLTPQPVTPLPTTALPVPGQSSTPRGADTKGPSSHRHHKKPARTHGFHLSATPASVAPMQRINLTGTYPGHDNMSVEVQRYEGGHWTSFAGVAASVHVGTFQTYVMTGRSGVNKFRMFDPASGRASNPVDVTIGG